MRVAVLGAGLQGACVAMELASAGVDVDLYDKNDRCVSQASAQNEGKIHLGYVYANDRSLRTARTMIEGAVAFAPLMRRWVGRAIDAVPVSAPFHYIVHVDSMLSTADVEHHLRRSHAMAVDAGREVEPDYFGSDYREAPARISDAELGARFDRRTVAAAYTTREVAVEPEALAAVVRARLSEDPRIRCRLQTQVNGAQPGADGVTIEFETAGERARERYDHVVNALWDGRLAVDRTAGYDPKRPWLYRVKHYVRLHAPALAARVGSATIVLGSFGDVAAYGDGSLYLSWYPVGMRGASCEIAPPRWPLVLDERVSHDMRRRIVAGLTPVVPALADITPREVASAELRAGIIFAWGRTGIDDPASGLHERHAIGPRSRGRYHTVDTGKLTMAPLFGKAVADRIRQTD
ncbi:MAG TPA: FAD-dependent oxidoreductase [Candidatus Elarobacter sp.]|nr:FAD-dependent oxidoreductase [Candidatus Elarobacter sp.]